MTRVIFHSRGEFGIGHISRSIAIAKALTTLDNDVVPLMITECRDTRLLQESGLPYVVIPSPRSLKLNAYWGSKQMAESMWKELNKTTIRSFNPKIFVHDTIIYMDIFEQLKSMGVSQVLVMRRRKDLLDFINKTHNVLAQFDIIIIPHLREEMTPEELDLLPLNKTYFSGPVVRLSLNELDVAGMTRKYHLLPDHFKIIVVNGGGGVLENESDTFASLVGKALKKVQAKYPNVQVVAIYGPLYQEDCSDLFDLPGVRVAEFEPKMASLMAAGNLVISRGGYNTTNELLCLGVPAISIPAERTHDDQEERIIALSEATDHIKLGANDPDMLADQIFEQITRAQWFEFSPSTFKHRFARGKYKAANLIHQVVLTKQLDKARKMYNDLDLDDVLEELASASLISPLISK